MPTRADHNLVKRWIEAWTYVRGLDVTDIDGWPLVHVGSVSRESELICTDPGTESFAELLPHIVGDTRAMLTVIAADIAPYASIVLPSGVRVDRHDETLMSGRLTAGKVPAIDLSFATRWDGEGNSLTYAVEHEQRIAAEGTVGVLGTDAVYDAVETIPAYRRRGLAKHVMVALSNRAMDLGATHGVSAATSSGRQLYESLGWDPALQMWSLMGAQAADRP